MIEAEKMKRKLLALIAGSFLMSIIFGMITWWVALNTAKLDDNVALGAGLIVSLLVMSAAAFWLSSVASEPMTQVQKTLNLLNNPDANAAALPKPEELTAGKEITRLALKDIYDLSTGSNEAQLNLQNENELMNALFDASEAPIIAIDRNRLVKFANGAAKQLAPDTIEKMEGAEFDKAIPLEFPDEVTLNSWLDAAQDSVKETKTWQRIKLQIGDSEPHYFDMVASYNKNESHGIEVLVIMIDYTDIYDADNKEVSFVSLAVHELRSLITVLRGYIEVFEEEIGPSLGHEHVTFMNKMTVTAAQLSTFVNNILNVSRLENDQMKIHMQKEDWIDVMGTIGEDMKLRAEVRNRHLKFELPEKLPEVAVDRVSIYEVMSNLIDNAVKYSHDGGEIIIKVEDNGEGQVETTVQDFGIGIPSSVINHLFDKFYRSHRSRENIGGTGLGLYLCKQIIDAHNGSIWVKSVEGEGTTFGFTVPTYESVKEYIESSDSGQMVRSAHGWINNHGSIRR